MGHKRGHYTVQIPPLPAYLVLTDRADGTEWLLSWTTAQAGPDGNGYITITDTIPSRGDVKRYAAGEEPYLDEWPYRVFIRGGRIGVDDEALPQAEQDRDQAMIAAKRSDNRRKVRELRVSDVWEFGDLIGDVLAWVPRDM